MSAIATNSRPNRFSFGRAVWFVAIFSLLQLSWQAMHSTVVEYAVIHHGTVQPAAFLVNLITPDVHARAENFSVRAPGGGINVLNGCEGLEALFLLIAACVVAPASSRAKLVGFLIGVPVVFLVNQARILGLFYAYRHDHALFYPLHATVAPIAVILCVAAYFYVWLSYNQRGAAKAT
ncbi:MAG: archaeosortase/exosortase family protein [Candidatus Obscuribacterales bacterium]|nr:archaeosortase/exosortase family protein [Steroidobacteraceae bacterium]